MFGRFDIAFKFGDLGSIALLTRGDELVFTPQDSGEMPFATVEPFEIPRINILIDQHGEKLGSVEHVLTIGF